MTDLLLITTPDKVYNQNEDILLICPTKRTKAQFENILATTDKPYNIYIFNTEDEDIDWLLEVHRFCKFVIADLDNFSPICKQIESYLVSFSNTFWLTKGTYSVYNKISNNRIYSVDNIRNKIGGILEEESIQ